VVNINAILGSDLAVFPVRKPATTLDYIKDIIGNKNIGCRMGKWLPIRVFYNRQI
jgi:hypothetical protein